MTFKEKLVKLRKLKKITQDEFACAVGVSRQAVYKWESGQSYPEVPKLIEMKHLFGISIDDLLDDSFDVIIEKAKKSSRKKTLPPPVGARVPAPEAEAAPVTEEAPVAAPVVEEAPVAAPVAAPAATAAPADDLDEFDFEATENTNNGAGGNLFDMFIKKK